MQDQNLAWFRFFGKRYINLLQLFNASAFLVEKNSFDTN